MTKTEHPLALSSAEFYDALASDYDAMTGFEKRFVRERPFFHVLVDRYRIKTALDAGSGTGFHSLLLSQLGVEVTAVDVSQDMLNKLRQHAEQLHARVGTYRSDLRNLTDHLKKEFDAVFSLGNTLAHFLRDEDLFAVLKQFRLVTKPGGVMILQVLNYERILSARERIQSVTESAGKNYVRYYEYDNGALIFNIAVTEKESGSLISHQSIPLRPIIRPELESIVERAGWIGVKSFGGISMEEFVGATSNDLVLTARKPGE